MEKWLSGSLRVTPRPVRRQARKPSGETAHHMHERMEHRMRNRSMSAHQGQHALARFGKPQRLFKDSDKDGVPNVFDCKPFNKKKQDVISPPNFGGGMRDMFARREGNRMNRIYMAQMREASRLEQQRLLEAQRINALPVQVVDNTRTIYSDTPYVVTSSGKWVSATSVEGKKAIKDFTAPTKTNTSNDNANFMKSLGYSGQSTATGTVWTQTPVTASQILNGGSSGTSRNSGGGGGYSAAPTTSYSAPKAAFVGPTRPSNYTAPPVKRSWRKPSTWFRK